METAGGGEGEGGEGDNGSGDGGEEDGGSSGAGDGDSALRAATQSASQASYAGLCASAEAKMTGWRGALRGRRNWKRRVGRRKRGGDGGGEAGRPPGSSD